jgi:hypothetical protein
VSIKKKGAKAGGTGALPFRTVSIPPRVHPFYADLRAIAKARLAASLPEIIRFLESDRAVPIADRDGGLLEIDRALANMAAGDSDLALARIDRIVQYRRALPAMQAAAKVSARNGQTARLPRKVTDAVRRDMVRRHRAGQLIKTIALELGFDRKTVSKVVNGNLAE